MELPVVTGKGFREMSRLYLAQFLSQLVPVLAYPLLGRLFSPAQFGLYALFGSMGIMALTVLFWRLEQALLLPINDQEEKGLYHKCLQIGLGMLLPLSGLFALYTYTQADVSFGLTGWFAIYLAAAGWGLLLQQRLFRYKRYPEVNRYRLVQALAMVILASLAGKSQREYGLIEALALSQVIGLLLIPKGLFFDNVKHQSPIRYVLRAYADFPIFNALPAFMESAGRLLPFVFLIQWVGADETGLFGNASRFLAFPVAALQLSLGPVAFRRWSEHLAKNSTQIRHELLQRWLPLWLVCLVPVAPVIYFSEDLLVWFLGSQWEGIGLYVKLLSPVFLLMAFAVPFEPLFKVMRKQGWFMVFGIIQLATRVGVYQWVFKEFEAGFSLAVFSVVESAIILCFVMLSFHILSKPSNVEEA